MFVLLVVVVAPLVSLEYGCVVGFTAILGDDALYSIN